MDYVSLLHARTSSYGYRHASAVDVPRVLVDAFSAPVTSPAVSPSDPLPPPTPICPPLAGGGPLVTLTRGQLARKDVVTRTSGVRLGVVTQGRSRMR